MRRIRPCWRLSGAILIANYLTGFRSSRRLTLHSAAAPAQPWKVRRPLLPLCRQLKMRRQAMRATLRLCFGGFAPVFCGSARGRYCGRMWALPSCLRAVSFAVVATGCCPSRVCRKWQFFLNFFMCNSRFAFFSFALFDCRVVPGLR